MSTIQEAADRAERHRETAIYLDDKGDYESAGVYGLLAIEARLEQLAELMRWSS